MDETFRCRKCGCVLYTVAHLVNEQGIENEEMSGFTQWFLNHESCPEWAEQAILKEQYTRGKLICPKCQGRIGAFDFVGKREHFQLGPVWIQKCRVDLIRRIPIAPAARRPTVQHPPFTENPSHDTPAAEQTDIESELLGSEASSVVSAQEEAFSLRRNSGQFHPASTDSHGDTNANIKTDNSEADSLQTEELTPPIVLNENRFSCLPRDTEPIEDDPEPRENRGFEQKPTLQNEDMPVLSDVESAYTCPICLDVLFQAHTCRPCLHVYCAPCLRRLCGSSPFNTKCPLCRQVIAACLPNHEMSNIVKSVFPREYNLRKSLEKKNRRKLPPLPSSRSVNFTHFNRDRNRNYVLVHWAGVCFVVLLIVMAISILATTVGMLLWYLWETFMDYFIDGLVSINGYFDYSWQLIIMILLEKSDEISPELAKKLAGSFGQVLHAVGKLFNRSVETPPALAPYADEKSTKESAQLNYVISAFQVDFANYVLVMCVVTYLIYRFARYRQARQVEATQLQ